MTAVVNEDVDTIASDGEIVTLSSGLEVQIERIRTRQLMRFLKILTRGAGGAIGGLLFDGEADAEEFTSSLLAAVVLSIPEAEDETIDFIKSLVSPKDLIIPPRTDADRSVNNALIIQLDDELHNPDLEDLVVIFERLIAVEGPHILALGKRLAVLLKLESKVQTAKQKSVSRKPKSSSTTSTAS